jgi:hypothetical protein
LPTFVHLFDTKKMINMKNIKFLSGLVVALILVACDSKPKVIEADSGVGEAAPPLFQDVPAIHDGTAPAADMNTAERKVVAEEVLDTDKYTYIRVKEKGEEFWVAVMRQDIKVGGTYYFQGGLLKKNFQSKEYNRVFETLYLVSDFRGENPAATASGQGTAASSVNKVEPPKNVNLAPGAIKIADLVANLKKYEGKSVKVTGKIMKVNAMIMGRNWIHLQDGSGNNLELTVTTTEQLQAGSTVTLEGTIALNKDFGAGYVYDYIMEGAVVR